MKKLILITAIAVFALSGCGVLGELMTVMDEPPAVSESVPEPSTEPETESFTELVTESETEPPTESPTESETESPTESVTEPETEQIFDDYDDNIQVEYSFRTKKQLEQHFEKHGSEFDGDFDYETAEEYEDGASDVINNPDALYKTEKEDGDGVYYLESTNEFVILSTDGYIRTYFRPSAGIDYFNRQ